MTWIEELQQFSSNGGLYHKGVSPQWGEPYYEIVNQKMLKRKFKPGDKVRIAVKRSDTDDPTVFDGSNCAWCANSKGIIFNNQRQQFNLIVAPAFNLNLSKIEIIGNEISKKSK